MARAREDDPYRSIPLIASIPLDGEGQDTCVRWDGSKNEKCMITRDDAGELATWSIVDAHGTVLRSGTWRVEERT